MKRPLHMPRIPRAPLCASALSLALALGCSKNPTPSVAIDAPSSSASNTQVQVTDGWVGQWNGPEGTYLSISGSNGRYDLTIKNLDGPRSFKGSAAEEQIDFERDGAKETLKATDGQGTGMKWLTEKKNCLTVKAGEGFCRN